MAAPTGIGIVEDNRIIWCNKLLGNMLGYNQEELLHKPLSILFTDEATYQSVFINIRNVVHLLNICSIETQWQHKNGQVIDVLLRVTSHAVDESLSSLTFTALDITNEKQSQQELIKFKTIADTSNYGRLIADTNGNIIYANQTLAAVHAIRA